ncbi:MAG: hypothetical protein HQ486_08570 [Acidimicrobiaceae bacterium]|nr:hypothetical protein [Acidimicrobiaceae bacterium]
MFFKNGNEPQIPIAGFDNKIHSVDGKDFTKGSGNVVSSSACKSIDGAAAGFLGDPQVVKVASGYLAFAHDLQTTGSAPWKRHACALTSSDGITIDKLDPVTNLRSGMQIRTSTNDGASWTELSELSFYAADPDRLDFSTITVTLVDSAARGNGCVYALIGTEHAIK